ncbi:3198_t:CDS:1, partial [Gigaspora rosea]
PEIKEKLLLKMQFELDLLKQRIIKLETENVELKAKKVEFKARIIELEQNTKKAKLRDIKLNA